MDRLAIQGDLTSEVFENLIRLVEENTLGVQKLEVQKALVRVVLMLYPLNPSSAHTLLTRLVKKEPDVQNAIIELISLLINQDWETGFPLPREGIKKRQSLCATFGRT